MKYPPGTVIRWTREPFGTWVSRKAAKRAYALLGYGKHHRKDERKDAEALAARREAWEPK